MTTDQISRLTAGDNRAVSAFVEKLRGSYDVSETILFGSRARGDNRSDSDLDLAVVLNGKRGDFVSVKLDMAGLAFDVLMETGILVQAFPMWGMTSLIRSNFPIRPSSEISHGKAFGSDDAGGHGQGAEGARLSQNPA